MVHWVMGEGGSVLGEIEGESVLVKEMIDTYGR